MQFHTPGALADQLGRDVDGAIARVVAMPQQNARLRPYQAAASAAIEGALGSRKWSPMGATRMDKMLISA